MKVVFYLHGFRSSPQSVKAQQFARAIAALPAALRPRFEVPALPPDPVAAIALAAGLIGREEDAAEAVTLVGSSLGGYYATHLAETHGVRAALINPAVRPYDDLAAYVGTQRNLYTGEAFEVTPTHFTALRALKPARITQPGRYFLLVRSGDELLDWREAVAFYGGARQYVLGGGDHGWADFAPEIPAILRFADVAVPTP
jgi:predicted esterase YcpF (UPF0227 family)